MTIERLTAIAYNAICGLEELVGYTSMDVLVYCGMTLEEYNKIMHYWDENNT